ncbi:MAG: hypothetical protein H6736_06065 [Alphaproteobacteria bacterium]|nr:hypothetical protein [Alphaproteobacteria bacterium]
MILLALQALAAPTDAEIRAAARLVVDSESLAGIDGVQVRAALADGVPWIDVFNTGATPVEIRWADSRLTPPNGQPGPMLVLQRADHDPAAPASLPEPTLLLPHDGSSWAVFPAAWVDDGPENDAEQVAGWSQTSFSGLELALTRGTTAGTYTALWHTDFDQAALAPAPEGPLAIAAAPRPVPRPVPPSADLEARRQWDESYRLYRRQGRTARTAWVTSAIVGGLCLLGTVSAGEAMSQAPATGPDDRGYTREDYRDTMLVYSALTGGAVGVMVPMVLLERSSDRKLRDLGRRP